MIYFFRYILCLAIIGLFFQIAPLKAQTLEDVIVEEYVTDVVSGTTTYRVFLDMGEGDKLLAVYGFDDEDPDTGNDFGFSTSTTFYQDPLGSDFGESLNSLLFSIFETAAVDSWVSVGGAAIGQAGIPLSDDTDGSALVSFVSPDGYVASTIQTTNSVGIPFPGGAAVSEIGSSDGAYFIAGGADGVGPNNTILIGQFTTDGDFEFRINVQLQNGDDEILFLHTNEEQPDGTFGIVSPLLTFPITGVLGCTDVAACNYDVNATVDDGSCIVPVDNCSECNAEGDGLVLIDDDGDGICNAEEVPGCTNFASCNYNPNATDDDGSCTEEPVENCSFCVGGDLVLIDDDGDGICDAEEIPGCTNALACNFNPEATDDDGSCTDTPVENCTTCQGDELVLIDDDGDGICNADEIAGCTNELACNFNSEATDDDDSCLVPVIDCSECDGEVLVIIDDDNDGVCNAEDECPLLADLVNGDPCMTEGGEMGTIANCECELIIIEGCISETACNYNEEANLDDGSCIEPVENCFICNATNDGLIIIDSDEDGICDAEEIPGCTNSEACNFNVTATDDDGSCLIPEPDCTECDGEELILIDDDGDGICNAEEILGCTDMLACNFDQEATDDDGSCLVPELDCTECDGTDLVLIDDDGDGVCNANEIDGCTNDEACNFDPEATEDDGTCLVPEPDCSECDGAELILIDDDGDGICNAQEIPGCTDEEAVNYNPEATDDDGSCLFEAIISLLDFDCGGAILQVSNAQPGETDGGVATEETRTIYAFGPDQGAGNPTYTGEDWPYVRVPVGFTVSSGDITAALSVNENNILLVNGNPAYQFVNDISEEDANGNFGPWSYFTEQGELTQDPCDNVSSDDLDRASTGMSIYPNPSGNEFWITLNNQEFGENGFVIQAYDALGNKVFERKLDRYSGQRILIQNSVDWSSGVYLINIDNGSERLISRFVKTE